MCATSDEILLKFCCPRDGRKLSPVPLMRHATQAVQRKCSACHRWYSLIVRPAQEVRAGIFLTKAEITELPARALREV